MNIKRLFALIISAALILGCLCACAPKETDLASSHISAENEHSHEHTQSSDKTQNTASKKPSNKNDKNTSSIVQVGIKRPIATKRDENVDFNKYEELPSYSITVSERLFEDVDRYDNMCLYFYNVKNTNYASTSYIAYDVFETKLGHYKEFRDERGIRDFKVALSLYTWAPKKFTAKTAPSIAIYFDDDFHLNVEGEVDGAFWLSLNASYGKVYYIVPEAVYDYVVEFCREK